jgi:hypothetical protein
MWKKVLIISGGVALAVALPVAALAITTGDDVAEEAPSTFVAEEVVIDATPVALNATYEPQRLRAHADTGPPDGLQPIQNRLHQGEATGAGDMNHERQMNAEQHKAAAFEGAGQGAGQQGPGQHQGNPNAPMGDGSGECDHEGEPMNSGPRGPGGNRG